MCGGAQARARPTSVRRFRGERHSTGQTTKKRKAGSRVTSKNAFVGEGSRLATDGAGSGFRKQAKSKRAREERALAAEKRLKALQDQTPVKEEESEEDDSDDEIEIIETDAERRQTLLNTGEQENDLLRLDKATSWKEFQREFNFGYARHDDNECDLPVASGSTFTTGSTEQKFQKPTPKPVFSRKGKSSSDIGLGKLVQTEIQVRKREAVGMTGPGRTLADSDDDEIVVSEPSRVSHILRTNASTSVSQAQWECLVCTLLNEPSHLACAACGTTRGENT